MSGRFPNAHRLVLGNLPDRERADRFFHHGQATSSLDEHESQVGRWWSSEQIVALADSFGWEVTLSRMADDFFNANYRFDAILYTAMTWRVSAPSPDCTDEPSHSRHTPCAHSPGSAK